MKFIGWKNCQGVGKDLRNSNKMEYLAKLMASTRAQIIFLSEIRTSRYISSQLNSRFNIADNFVVAPKGLSGGLWLLWSDKVQVIIKCSNHYLILALVVRIATNLEFALACVYGDPHHRHTRMIWDQISSFVSDNTGKPVVCLGDLNNIMYDVDTTSSNINHCRMRTFIGYVKQCGLFDLGFSGPAYTWTNKHFSSTPVFERLDRCLVNVEWCNVFPTQMFLIFLLFLEIMRLYLFQLNLNFIDRNSISNLKIGGPYGRRLPKSCTIFLPFFWE